MTKRQLQPVDQAVPPIWGANAETATLDIVVFSKDRACQLDALLRSIRAFLDLPHRIHVLYTTTTPDFELGYDLLRAWHRGVEWCGDKGAFHESLLQLMTRIDNGPGRYLMFLVDDMMMIRPFTAHGLMDSLDEDEDILAVSLRLGENVTACYPRDIKTTPPDFSRGYRWHWSGASPGYWDYPMSLDANIYRTTDITELLPRLHFLNPSSLEAALAGRPLPRPEMVCEKSSCLINIPANRVQTVFQNRCGDISAEFLNESFLAGKAIDVGSFAGKEYDACHIELELPLIDDMRSRAPPGIRTVRHGKREFYRIDLREILTFVLNCKEDNEKRMLMREQLIDLGMNFEIVETLRVKPGWVGVALAHLKALRFSRARPPFLVLEDDCVFNEHFSPVIEVPAQADALYLGSSIFGIEHPGALSWGKQNKVVWERYDDSHLRVYNMLARHALLYLDPGFQAAVIESQVEALTHRQVPHMGDIAVAMLQYTHTTLVAEPIVCRQVNRDSTNENLASALPWNEINSDRQDNQPRPAKQSERAGLSDTDCYVSHRHRFIYFPIAKNASSTLAAEFQKPRYQCERARLGQLDERVRHDYLKFTFLRDPVSRLASAYQEISLRDEMDDTAGVRKPFMKMADTPERFAAFLQEIENDKWDVRLMDQGKLLDHIPMDFYGRVESLESDLAEVFRNLGLGDCPGLPLRRSRQGRSKDYGYDRFNIDHQQFAPQQVGRIRELYRDDVILIEGCCPAPPLCSAGESTGSSGQGNGPELLPQAQPVAPAPISNEPVRFWADEALEQRIRQRREDYWRANREFGKAVVYRVTETNLPEGLWGLAWAMIHAFAHERQLLVNIPDRFRPDVQQWYDLFQPLLRDSSAVDADLIEEHISIENEADVRKLAQFRPEHLKFPQTDLRGFDRILGFFLQMLVWPTRDCQERLEPLLGNLPFHGGYEAVCIEPGKAQDGSGALPDVGPYLDCLQPLAEGQSLCVVADGDRVLTDISRALAGNASRASVFSARSGLNGDSSARQIRSLADLTVLLRSRRFVASAAGVLGRSAWLMHARNGWCHLLDESGKVCTAGSNAWVNTRLKMRDGRLHELELESGSSQLEPLWELTQKRRLDSRGSDSRLIQLPVDGGCSALAFSMDDLLQVSLTPAATLNPEHLSPCVPCSEAGSATPGAAGKSPEFMNTDEGHLGGYVRSRHPRSIARGWIHGDPATWFPDLWRWTRETLGVDSVLDVGCGEGHASAYFRDLGCRVLGIDGSKQAERDSVIPDRHRHHDFIDGPFIPDEPFEMIWCCEFVEHVEERYAHHFLATFSCAQKYILMTFAGPGQPGWHHANCQPMRYWVNKLERLGFTLDEDLTRDARERAGHGHFKRAGLVFIRTD